MESKQQDAPKEYNENVRKETMDKFIDMELKVLSIIRFDMNYDEASPFTFITDFLHANYSRLQV
jgi:hypothetical protein